VQIDTRGRGLTVHGSRDQAVSGKFGPIHQYLFFDATEVLPPNVTEADAQPVCVCLCAPPPSHGR
jgi:hypothetical protein